MNAPQPDGATALHWAAHRDDLTTADLLIRAGARANAANDLGVTPLYLACTNRSAAMVKKLLTAGANPNATLLRGQTVLMECARTGDVRAVTALLAAGAQVNAKESINDQTALMWAVAQQHPRVVQALIELGADIQARSRTYPQNVQTGNRGGGGEVSSVFRGGSTPLLFAARVGDVESAKLLLAAGADVNDSAAGWRDALWSSRLTAVMESSVPCCWTKALTRTPPKSGTPRCMRQWIEAILASVKALLAHGANPNLRITKGFSGQARQQRFSAAIQADRIDGVSAGGEVRRSRDHARPGCRRSRSAGSDAGRDDGAHAGGGQWRGSCPRRARGMKRAARFACATGASWKMKAWCSRPSRVALSLGQRRQCRQQGRRHGPAQRGLHGIRHRRAAARGEGRRPQRQEQARTDAVGGDNGRRRRSSRSRAATRTEFRRREHGGAAAQIGSGRITDVNNPSGLKGADDMVRRQSRG